MEEKSQPGLFASIKNIIGTSFRLVGDMAQLAKLEAQLAGRSMVRIIALSYVIGTFFTSTWLCILALIIYYLKLYFSWPVALSCAIALNLLIVGVLLAMIMQCKKNLFFPATRRQLLTRTKDVKKESVNG